MNARFQSQRAPVSIASPNDSFFTLSQATVQEKLMRVMGISSKPVVDCTSRAIKSLFHSLNVEK
jgi:hypothetical protein